MTAPLRWLRRLTWLLFGGLWFLWLGYEDRTTLTVILLALVLGCALFVEGWIRWARQAAADRRGLHAAALGLAVGALIPPLAALLILVKISLHTHEQPDFTLEQMLLTLGRTPAWAVAGLLAGGAIGLVTAGDDESDGDHFAGSEGLEYNGQKGQPPKERGDGRDG